MAAMAIVILAATHCEAADIPRAELVRYVNILQGTDSDDKFSHGNTLPLVGTPWAMTDWSPRTAAAATTHDGTIDIRSTRYLGSGPRISRAPGWAITAIS